MKFQNRIQNLEREMGIQTSLMSNYFTSKASPTIENATKIADVLDVTLDELVGRVVKTELSGA